MEPTNLHLLYHSNFIDTKALPGEPKLNQYLWWTFVTTELLLITRLLFEYLAINPTNLIASNIYLLTNYLLYPFSFLFENTSTSTDGSQILLIAIASYVALVAILRSIVRAYQSPRSRIEDARALSRKKYTS